MANAEAAAKGEEGIVDRMSKLPDDLLRRIFSFLPSHRTIRLSSLSSRYRYLWRSVPTLDFLDNHYPRDTFEEVMENALKHHGNLETIRRFRLRCYGREYNEFLISKWMNLSTAPSCSNLQGFDVHLVDKYRVTLTCAIFSCPKLERIRLSGGIVIDEIPTDARVFLPCLKTLQFRWLSIQGDNTLNKLLYGCPRIETFDVEDCFLRSDKPRRTVTIKKLKAAGDVLKSISGTVKQLEMCTNMERSLIWEPNEKVVLPSLSYYRLETVKINGVDGRRAAGINLICFRSSDWL
ncbi:hypothetical protein V6N13_086471 [Hibiscus sabdariffa]